MSHLNVILIWQDIGDISPTAQGWRNRYKILVFEQLQHDKHEPFHFLPSFILPTPLQGKYDTRSTDEEGKAKEPYQQHTTSQHLALTGSLHRTDLHFTGCISFLLLL